MQPEFITKAVQNHHRIRPMPKSHYSSIEDIDLEIEPYRVQLLNHPVYQRVHDIFDLRVFMRHHVFAVWDFMSLLKSLQRQLGCFRIPWVPSGNSDAVRLVNEIAVAEESDEDVCGTRMSHFELYRAGMIECGASTEQIDHFIDSLLAKRPLDEAIADASLPPSVSEFVLLTFQIIERESLVQTAAAFVFGREDLIPEMFKKIVANLSKSNEGRVDRVLYYLERHIEIDEGEHGPAARRLVADLCGSDHALWCEARDVAIAVLKARNLLWDGIGAALEHSTA